MKFSIKDFFCKCDEIRRKLQIWSHVLKKSLMENFIFRANNFSFIKNESLYIFSRAWRFWRRSDAFVVNFQNLSNIF